jgi:ubiquinone/menaquinone biosynthesis C-methylase UbiE
MSDFNTSYREMRLGGFELRAMNNWLRRLIQRKVEFPIFRRMLAENRIDLRGKTIMDAGCGSGYSSRLIHGEYHPRRLIAFDFMPEQIETAKRNYPELEFQTGDMRRIASADGSCDAVFIFGVLHHIPEWKGALKEVYRVLKNGGSLLLEEPRFRFSCDELESAMRETGFAVKGSGRFFFGRFHSYLAVK